MLHITLEKALCNLSCIIAIVYLLQLQHMNLYYYQWILLLQMILTLFLPMFLNQWCAVLTNKSAPNLPPPPPPPPPKKEIILFSPSSCIVLIVGISENRKRVWLKILQNLLHHKVHIFIMHAPPPSQNPPHTNTLHTHFLVMHFLVSLSFTMFIEFMDIVFILYSMWSFIIMYCGTTNAISRKRQYKMLWSESRTLPTKILRFENKF